MRDLFKDFLKSKVKTPDRVPEVTSSPERLPEDSRTRGRPTGISKPRRRSVSSEARTRRRSISAEKRTRSRSVSAEKKLPKYIYLVDIPEDLRNALRVSHFYLFL